jgi:hypothetical protein
VYRTYKCFPNNGVWGLGALDNARINSKTQSLVLGDHLLRNVQIILLPFAAAVSGGMITPALLRDRPKRMPLKAW